MYTSGHPKYSPTIKLTYFNVYLFLFLRIEPLLFKNSFKILSIECMVCIKKDLKIYLYAYKFYAKLIINLNNKYKSIIVDNHLNTAAVVVVG